MSIHQNLRQLRLQCKMTQEQVAQKVGITRQALSGYESGRTRPDIDMLLSLARVYKTDLDNILYGQERHLRAMHRIRIISVILFWILTLLTVLSATFHMIANRFFPLSPGQVAPEMMAVLDAHIRLNNACGFTDSLILSVVPLGFVLLLILRAAEKVTIPAKTKLLYSAVIFTTLLAIAGLFAAADPVFTVVRYAATSLWIIAVLAIVLLIDYILKKVTRDL